MFSPKKLVQLPVCSQNGKGQTNLLVKKKITLDYHLTWNMKAIITTSRRFCLCKREKFTGQHHRVRWMSSSQSDFYERIDEIISPQKTEKGIYLKDFASFWVQSKGLLFGQVIRIVWSPSFKSSYPAFEWKEDASKKGKVIPFALSAGHVQRLV